MRRVSTGLFRSDWPVGEPVVWVVLITVFMEYKRTTRGVLDGMCRKGT